MRVVNDKAKFNYELGERVEAGMVLSGAEVKSVKLGQVDMGNSYARIRSADSGKTEVWVVGLHIYPYKQAGKEEIDPQKTRKLLLHREEIVALQSKMKQARLLLVPTAIYVKRGKVKMELGLARGKKKWEKRETIKKRDLDRSEKW